MRTIEVNKETSDQHRPILIRFIERYGDQHITKKAIDWFKKTPFYQLHDENGDFIHMIMDKNRIIGVLVIVNYGFNQAFIVVHPKTRQNGVAYQLVTQAQSQLNRFYVKVANDNIPSLKLCFATGMQAFVLIKGPTGKPTLVLGSGHWSKEDWETNKK
ncbi:GNAT family N-acetyltransferase [Tepidibacillus marianensis]|uniref:GNAT family N-acetyltransferase n=1 Tax=Tepidibacillus marianensis TaxID=3131995 RepID=UPI0030CDF2BE